jgi:hypothetical protein
MHNQFLLSVFAGSFFFLSTKKRKKKHFSASIFVLSLRQIGRKRNENMNVTRVTRQPNIKCDEFNTLSSVVSDESNSSCRVVCGVLKAPEISIFQSALLYSFAHTSSRERITLTHFTHILRRGHQPPAHTILYGYFHFIIIHRYKYFSIKRIKAEREEDEKS